MKGIERWTIDDCRLVSDQHAFRVIEGVDNNCASVSKTDLEDGVPVFAPPGLADGGMIVAKFEEMPSYGEGARDFWDAFDIGDVGCS
jgi:hypothetical protein